MKHEDMEKLIYLQLLQSITRFVGLTLPLHTGEKSSRDYFFTKYLIDTLFEVLSLCIVYLLDLCTSK